MGKRVGFSGVIIFLLCVTSYAEITPSAILLKKIQTLSKTITLLQNQLEVLEHKTDLSLKILKKHTLLSEQTIHTLQKQNQAINKKVVVLRSELIDTNYSLKIVRKLIVEDLSVKQSRSTNKKTKKHTTYLNLIQGSSPTTSSSTNPPPRSIHAQKKSNKTSPQKSSTATSLKKTNLTAFQSYIVSLQKTNKSFHKGYVFYNQKKYIQAADSFLTAYKQTNSDNIKHLISGIYVAQSLIQLKSYKTACTMVTILTQQYPDIALTKTQSETIRVILTNLHTQAKCASKKTS